MERGARNLWGEPEVFAAGGKTALVGSFLSGVGLSVYQRALSRVREPGRLGFIHLRFLLAFRLPSISHSLSLIFHDQHCLGLTIALESLFCFPVSNFCAPFISSETSGLLCPADPRAPAPPGLGGKRRCVAATCWTDREVQREDRRPVRAGFSSCHTQSGTRTVTTQLLPPRSDLQPNTAVVTRPLDYGWNLKLCFSRAGWPRLIEAGISFCRAGKHSVIL